MVAPGPMEGQRPRPLTPLPGSATEYRLCKSYLLHSNILPFKHGVMPNLRKIILVYIAFLGTYGFKVLSFQDRIHIIYIKARAALLNFNFLGTCTCIET